MKKFFLLKGRKLPSVPIWSRQVFSRQLCYHGGDVETFLQEFDRIEDEILALWNASHLTWGDYQRNISELEEARQQFARFAYN